MTSTTSNKSRANKTEAPAPVDETPAEQTVVDQPAEGTASTTPETSKEDREKAIRDIYSESMKELREKYREEFNALRVAKAAERGIEWKPELTAAEKAEAQVKELIEKHPELAEKLRIGAETTE